MEHPELYTDEQWQELLSDEECRKLYEAMRLSVSAFEAEDAKQKIANGIKEEKWQKFEAEHFPQKQHSWGWMQIAAMFIGVLMLSGIAYAAVQIVRHNKVGGDLQSPTQEVRISNSPQMQGKALSADSTAQPVVYEDAELATIVNDISTFYQVKPVYKKEDSKHIRLYFTWDKHSSIDDIVDTFNKFERIHITREDKKLIVE